MADPVIGIIMGSSSDEPTMQKGCTILDELQIPYDITVCSAHRNPDRTAEYARAAKARGLKVIIAGAGLAAALPGVIAAHTTLPGDWRSMRFGRAQRCGCPLRHCPDAPGRSRCDCGH